MTERGPRPYPAADSGSTEWDMSQTVGEAGDVAHDVLAAALRSHAEATHDIGWGAGRRYQVGPNPDADTHLELFPASGVVRVTTTDAQLTLFRQPPPTIEGDRVSFRQEHSHGKLDLTLTHDGRLRLELTPVMPDRAAGINPTTDTTPLLSPDDVAVSTAADTNEPPATAPSETTEIGPNSAVEDANGPTIPFQPQAAPSGDSGGAPMPIHAPSEIVESAVSGNVESEKPQRLTLAGRLGRVPSFRTTRSGTLIASFPLAVRDDAGETTWHTVLAFGERAEQLREGLAKGQHLEVIGYLHQRERTTRSGETRTIDEIYATVVRSR